MKPYSENQSSNQRTMYTPTGYSNDPPVAFDARALGKEATFPGQIINFGSSASLTAINYHQFEYITKGSGYIEFEGQKHEVRAGDFFFFKKAFLRTIHSDMSDPMEKFFLTAKGKFCDGVLSSYLPDKPFIICKCDVSEHFQNMISICESNETRSVQLYNELSIEFLKIIHSVSQAVSSQETFSGKITAESIMHYIDENVKFDFTLEDLSQVFFLSPSGLVKIFRSRYNTTPMKYAMEKRISLAKYYLSHTDLSIAQIAEIVPIGNTKYFSNLFKKMVGITPTEYRNRRKNK